MSSANKITVAGGVYLEVCIAPHRRDLYGSGGRAAAVISALGGATELSTYLDPKSKDDFEPIAAVHRFDVRSRERSSPITFGYAHPMARPDIVPSRHCIPQQAPISTDTEYSLRFGMVEGTAVVRAKQAVYDPQDLDRPDSFRVNGSTAERLALVLNSTEARLLLREPMAADNQAVAAALASQEGATVVVIKEGAAGALVWERGVATRVPAYRTSKVWKIGSGDTFSGAFAFAWMIEGRSAPEAARRASLASAHYCQGGSVSSVTSDAPLQEVDARVTSPEQPRLIYLAGPFFTTAELWLVAEAWRFFRNSRLPVFSPYHDVGRGAAHDVGPKDIAGIRRSSVMLALVDGSDPGTLFEVGYARALNIPVIALAEDPKKEDLTMLEGSGCEIYQDFAAALYRVAALV